MVALATSATGAADRMPFDRRALASSTDAIATMIAASTATQVGPSLKQTSAAIATVIAVMIAVGRSRAAAGPGGVSSGSGRGRGARGGAATEAAEAGAAARASAAGRRRATSNASANSASSSTGPASESAPSRSCSPLRSSPKSASVHASPPSRKRGWLPVTGAQTSKSSSTVCSPLSSEKMAGTVPVGGSVQCGSGGGSAAGPAPSALAVQLGPSSGNATGRSPSARSSSPRFSSDWREPCPDSPASTAACASDAPRIRTPSAGVGRSMSLRSLTRTSPGARPG